VSASPCPTAAPPHQIGGPVGLGVIGQGELAAAIDATKAASVTGPIVSFVISSPDRKPSSRHPGSSRSRRLRAWASRCPMPCRNDRWEARSVLVGEGKRRP